MLNIFKNHYVAAAPGTRVGVYHEWSLLKPFGQNFAMVMVSKSLFFLQSSFVILYTSNNSSIQYFPTTWKGFKKFKNYYTKSAYYSICDHYSGKAVEI